MRHFNPMHTALRKEPIAHAPGLPVDDVPLCVDLDGTLIRSNLFLESVLLMLKKKPWLLLVLPWWLMSLAFSPKIRSHSKDYLARQIMDRFEPEHLPYETDFLAWLHVQKAKGRRLWLCTGSHHSLAQRVADHVGIFEGVMGSHVADNFVGEEKAVGLVAAFGENGFDYAGNSHADVKVWQRSRKVLFVNVSEMLAAKWSRVSAKAPEIRFGHDGVRARDVWRSIRPHQWVKNILVFVPLITAQHWNDLSGIGLTMLAFVAFSLCASSVYLFNDLLDLNADRQHPKKRHRPLASGALPLDMGGILSGLLLIAAAGVAMAVGWRFFGCLAGYWALTMAYSLHVKQMMVLDVIALAVLYTARIVAGAMAVAVPLSFWLFLFSVFFFLSLALVKRYAELDHLQRNKALDASGRGYRLEDLPLLHSIGTACGMMAVLVLGLYINAPEVKVLYQHPKAIWALCLLLLYWTVRVWLLAHRGQMKMDPVVFALEDKTSRVIAVLGVAALMVAL